MDIYDSAVGSFVKVDIHIPSGPARYSVLLHTGRRSYRVVGLFEDEQSALDWISRQLALHPTFHYSVHETLF